MRPSFKFSLILVILDLAFFSCLYLFFLRARLGFDTPTLGNIYQDFLPLAICLGSLILSFSAIRSYGFHTEMRSSRFAAEHGIACLTAFILCLFVQFSILLDDFSRSRLALAFTFITFTLVALLYRRWLYADFTAKTGKRSLWIIGAGHQAAELYQNFCAEQAQYLIRFIDFSGLPGGQRVDGASSPRIESMLEEDFLEEMDDSLEAVVLAEPVENLPSSTLEMLVKTHFSHVPILTLEAFYEQYWDKIPVTTSFRYPYWALQQDFRLARHSSYGLFKRIFDLAAAAFLLVLTFLPMLLCALALILERSGPVFYRQERTTRNRRSFILYKFRTMRVQPSLKPEDLYTRDKDDRITPVGRVLRKMRLDELPQLWNVLKGEMSLIGPRAEWVRCVEIYEREIPCYHFRHMVKPGITGWAQVNYPYGRSVQDTMNKLQYDLYYIKNYSFLLDATIILKTLYVVLSFKGK